MSRVIEHTMPTMTPTPVVFASGNNEDVECTGTDWEHATQAPGEGWICLAVRAEDLAGNIGVSRPLRLCYDDSSTGSVPDCFLDPVANPPPTCTDGCTLPPAFPDSIYLEY